MFLAQTPLKYSSDTNTRNHSNTTVTKNRGISNIKTVTYLNVSLFEITNNLPRTGRKFRKELSKDNLKNKDYMVRLSTFFKSE